jgi:type II secretory pathway predicted ATPase ExeA
MKYKLLLIVTLLLSISVLNAEAQLRGPRPYMRPGINNGITRVEAFRLRNMKQDLRRDYLRAKLNDGRIGPLERRQLKQERRQLRRAEFRFRNNRFR